MSREVPGAKGASGESTGFLVVASHTLHTLRLVAGVSLLEGTGHNQRLRVEGLFLQSASSLSGFLAFGTERTDLLTFMLFSWPVDARGCSGSVPDLNACASLRKGSEGLPHWALSVSEAAALRRTSPCREATI